MSFDRILVPVDFSEMSYRAARAADEIADLRGASLTLLHVSHTSRRGASGIPTTRTSGIGAAQRKLDTLANVLSLSEDRIETTVFIGDPVQAIVEASEAHDLVVLASSGAGNVRRFLLGSVVERVARAACCAVLVIEPVWDLA